VVVAAPAALVPLVSLPLLAMVVVAVAPVVVCWSVNNIIFFLKKAGGLTLWSPVLVVGI
jgi:hypothetical protein